MSFNLNLGCQFFTQTTPTTSTPQPTTTQTSNTPAPTGEIKIKGSDKTVDLSKLQGLVKTDQNQSIFNMKVKGENGQMVNIDADGNGVIDAGEAQRLAQYLKETGGRDDKISAKDFHQTTKALNQDAFKALQSIADQQNAYENGDHVEGDTTFHKGGSYTRGNVTTNRDGTSIIRDPETGTVQYKDAQGKVTKTEYKDGSYSIPKDGNGYEKFSKDNVLLEKCEIQDGKETVTNYASDGKTIKSTTTTETTEKNGVKVPHTVTRTFGSDGTSITGISESYSLPDGTGAQHKHELTFASEQDMEAGRPSREVVDGNIPSKKNSIEYTYDDNGKLIKQTEISGDGKTTSSTKFDRNGNKFVTTTTVNAQGERDTDVKFLDSSGKPLPDGEFGSSKFHVNRGESNTAIAKRALIEQGYKEEDITPAMIKSAKTMIEGANRDQLKTLKHDHGKMKAGTRYFYADANLKIPRLDLDKDGIQQLLEVEVIAPAPKKKPPLIDIPPITIKPEDLKIKTPKPAPELTPEQRSQQTYDNMMANWKDGSFKMQQNNKIITVEKTTLPNGERAFKYKGKYYQPTLNSLGLPDFAHEIKDINAKPTTPASTTTTVTPGQIKPQPAAKHDFANDTTYQAAQTRLNQLESQRQEIIRRFGGTDDMKTIDLQALVNRALMGTENWIDESGRINDILDDYDELNRNMTHYQNTMNNWQDGGTYRMMTGNLGTGTLITLTNGQKAIKFSSGVYPLGIDGFPNVKGRITDQSLIPQ